MSTINLKSNFSGGVTLVKNLFIDHYMINANGEYVKMDTSGDPFIAQEYCMQKAVEEADQLPGEEGISWLDKLKHWFQGA